MQTTNSIIISADPDAVYEKVSRLLDWPNMLPHYRWVEHIGGTGEWMIFEMSAWRSCIPIKWTSLTRIDLAARQIYFRHIFGLMRGMEVFWNVEPTDGGSKITIVHEMSRLKVPVLRSWPWRLIAGKILVEHVAGKTLAGVKQHIEAKATEQKAARCVEQS